MPNGIPQPKPSQLSQIFHKAHGTQPNGPPPSNYSAGAILSLKAIAFGEFVEVALYRQLLENVTKSKPGFEIKEYNRTFVIDSLTAIVGVSICSRCPKACFKTTG